MTYRCRICGVNEVDHQGGVCELCAIAQDPYAQKQTSSYGSQIPLQPNADGDGSYVSKRGGGRKVLLNGGTSLTNQDPYGNDMTDSDAQPSVQVYSAGQVPQTSQQDTPVMHVPPAAKGLGAQPAAAGITKNISVDKQKRSALVKWFSALFTGIPFALDDDVTMFQVFPDFTGTSLNALGNACDQVIVYGKLNNGAVSENNDVEVYGRRDSNNNIIARTIENKASGTTVTTRRTISQGVAWLITVLVIALLAVIISGLGVEGIIWTVVIILCLTNFPRVLKIVGVIFGLLFSIIKRLF